MKRLVIIGATGSGKTVLAVEIAAVLGLEFTDLDELHWLPGWQMRDREEFASLVNAAMEKPFWVISGNYREVRHLIWPRADTVLWLDYSLPRVFWQLLCRSMTRIRDRKLICNGNIETLPKLLSKDSIMIWLFQSYWRRKREFSRILDNPSDYPHIKFIRLRKPQDTQKWLERISFPPSPSAA